MVRVVGLGSIKLRIFTQNKEISKKVGLFFSRMFMSVNLD